MIYERSGIKDWSKLIKEGNVIKIRQWDDMESEYGYSSLENAIMCEHLFSQRNRVVRLKKTIDKY